MNFPETEAYLLSLGNEVETMKLGLDNIRRLLAELGDPQNNYFKVQVAGTNGKGSVCAFLDAICDEARIPTGTFTSPHLISITERIRINGRDISEPDFARHASTVRETAERLVSAGELEYTPTFFEQVTAIALLAFVDARVELAILETGMGGRFDATTAANAEIAAITRIDIDHQQYLGETLERIAEEKAAIINHNSIVCIGEQVETANSAIFKRCIETGVEPHTLRDAKRYQNGPAFDFVVERSYFGEVDLALKGEHQAENAALSILIAIQLKHFFSIDDLVIHRGLGRAAHPGRLEFLLAEDQLILLDGAHNLGGAQALARFLTFHHPDASIVLVYGAMRDKHVKDILSVLAGIATDVIITEPSNTRAFAATAVVQTLAQVGKKVFAVPNVEQAIDSAIQIAKTYPATKASLVVITGSLYLVGEAKRIFAERSEI